MIDLHTHILPGIDDGARDLEDALGMAELALESGVRTLVATPHSNQEGRFENYYSEGLEGLFGRLQRALRAEGLPLELLPGMEIFASDDLAEKIRRGDLIGLNRSRYYLVEFFFDESPGQIRYFLEQIFAAGGVPLIAHPERYFCVQEAPWRVYDWLELGCLTQVNKGSPLGRFGEGPAAAAEFLLEHDLVTCVASDAHRPYMRTTFMGDIQDYLSDQFGERVMRRLMLENPRRILQNEAVPPHGFLPERRPSYV